MSALSLHTSLFTYQGYLTGCQPLAWHSSSGSDPLSGGGGGFQQREQRSLHLAALNSLISQLQAFLIATRRVLLSHQHPDMCTHAHVTSRTDLLLSLCSVNQPNHAARGAGRLERACRAERHQRPTDDCGRSRTLVFPALLGLVLFQLQLRGARWLLRKWSEGGGEHFLSHKASGPEAKRHHISFQKSLLPASPFSSLWAHRVVRFFTFSYTPVPVSVLVGDPCVHSQGAGTGVPLSTRLCVCALIPSASTVRPCAGHAPCPWPPRRVAIQGNLAHGPSSWKSETKDLPRCTEHLGWQPITSSKKLSQSN